MTLHSQALPLELKLAPIYVLLYGLSTVLANYPLLWLLQGFSGSFWAPEIVWRAITLLGLGGALAGLLACVWEGALSVELFRRWRLRDWAIGVSSVVSGFAGTLLGTTCGIGLVFLSGTSPAELTLSTGLMLILLPVFWTLTVMPITGLVAGLVTGVLMALVRLAAHALR